MASETKVAAPFNFGPVSSRDKVLFTSERPGNTSIEKTNIADPAQVQDWLDFMTNQGVTYVIALLDENEYTDCYAAPGLFDAYRKAGLEAMVQPMNDPDASRNIFQAIRRTMESDNGKVVVHCTGGTGRAGRVAAGWLVDQ